MQILISKGLNIYRNICFYQGSENISIYKWLKKHFTLDFVTIVQFTQQFLRKTWFNISAIFILKEWTLILSELLNIIFQHHAFAEEEMAEELGRP